MDLNPTTPTSTSTPGPIPSLDHPVHHLDPHTADLHNDAALMRASGPLVPVHLPGGIPCWAITRDAVAREVLADTATFSVERRHWRA
ncbi:cytochrome P450, partial [Streptomyces sp. NPDC054796]